MRSTNSWVFLVAGSVALSGCGSSSPGTASDNVGGGANGGSPSFGGATHSGGSSSSGIQTQAGAVSVGGKSAVGAGGSSAIVATGGLSATGGVTSATGSTKAAGGVTSTGGTQAVGGNPAGGKSSTVSTAMGGANPNGGTTSAGGTAATGGTKAGGGTSNTAGTTATGGSGAGGKATGGSSAGGATAAGGAATYQPCPTNGNPCKIMPLGDSITWGVGDLGNGGYRGPLFGLAVAAGQKITFTGSQTNGPATVSGQTFPQKNEGHSGWGISQANPNSGGSKGLATIIPTPGFSTASGGVPNIILLHIGTNDSSFFTAAQMTSDLSGFLDQIFTNAPDAYLVIAQIIPLGYGTNAVIKTYNQSIPGLVQKLVNSGKHATYVDMYTGFTTSTMLGSDVVHPNTSGYKFMADRWYSVIGSMLPK